jgi:Protein of unknown function (DUF4230)
MKTALLAMIALILLTFLGIQFDRWRSVPLATAWSSGPTIEHLQSMSQLVCMRVSIADVLVGQNDDFRGSWLIKGDAVLAIELRQARIVECDPALRRARIRLPEPTVMSPRVDHERSRTWSVERLTWIPWKGDPDRLRDEAMKRAQQVIQAACGSKENVRLAKSSAETIIREFYGMVGWQIEVSWTDAKQP